ncbi:hypothetical protein ACP4OV_024076 [Aristida adscensionis]
METAESQEPSPLEPDVAPALLFDHGDGDGGGGGARFLYSIPKRRLLLARGLDAVIANPSRVTPQGWVLRLDDATRAASLWDPFTSRSVRLPPDADGVLAGCISRAAAADAGGGGGGPTCVMSTRRPTDPGCVVLVVHRTEPVLCYCRPGDAGGGWRRHEYRREELFVGERRGRGDVARPMAFLAAAGDRFYEHDMCDGSLVTLGFSPELEPELSSSLVTDTPLPTGCCIWEVCPVESCGDLFMVRFHYALIDERTILSVDVQRLDLSKRAFVKVTEIGDNRVFFAHSRGQFGASMPADELGFKPNSVCFFKSDDKGIYVYDIEQGTTTLHNPGPDIPDSLQPILLMPAT